mgnify:CR=1 FL=1
MDTLATPSHCPLVPTTVYVVLAVGLAVTLLPVEALKLEEGLQL